MARPNNHHYVPAGSGAAGGWGPNTWQSSESVKPIETTAKYLRQFVDIDEKDLAFLIARIDKSESAKAAVKALALKLKLEFGDELARDKQEKLDAARKAKEAAATRKARQAADEKAHIATLKKQATHFDNQLEELLAFLDENFVTRTDEIPDHLYQIAKAVSAQRMLRAKLFSRRFYIPGQVENPHREALKQVSFRKRR